MNLSNSSRMMLGWASLIVTDGSYEFEGTPKLKEIDDILTEMTSNSTESIRATICAGRSNGYPAIAVTLESESLSLSGNSRHESVENWKREVATIIGKLNKLVSFYDDTVATIHFSDGTTTRVSD